MDNFSFYSCTKQIHLRARVSILSRFQGHNLEDLEVSFHQTSSNISEPHMTGTVPVNNVIGLFCADDAEGIDGGVSGCEVGVLSRSSRETPRWALTASQKLTHAGGETADMLEAKRC